MNVSHVIQKDLQSAVCVMARVIFLMNYSSVSVVIYIVEMDVVIRILSVNRVVEKDISHCKLFYLNFVSAIIL